jgi:hypothetical protein
VLKKACRNNDAAEVPSHDVGRRIDAAMDRAYEKNVRKFLEQRHSMRQKERSRVESPMPDDADSRRSGR